MFCSNCGTHLSDDSDFCSNCGASVLKENSSQPALRKNKKTKLIVIVALCLVVSLCVGVISNQVGKSNLKKQLLRDWERVESNEGTYYTLKLDFSEDKIVYKFDSFYYDTTISTYNYTIISKNEFQIDGRSAVYRVKFNEKKTMMTITPALTSTDSSENWFNFD